jgi:hypothetical protein
VSDWNCFSIGSEKTWSTEVYTTTSRDEEGDHMAAIIAIQTIKMRIPIITDIDTFFMTSSKNL